DRELGAELSRIESLRIKADYTGAEIELKEAREVVRKAELFVQTVERVFSLDELSLAAEYKNHNPGHDDKVSEPTVATSKIERNDAHPQPTSPEETRRQARENWLRLRQQGIEGRKSVDRDRDAGRAAEQDQSIHSTVNSTSKGSSRTVGAPERSKSPTARQSPMANWAPAGRSSGSTCAVPVRGHLTPTCIRETEWGWVARRAAQHRFGCAFFQSITEPGTRVRETRPCQVAVSYGYDNQCLTRQTRRRSRATALRRKPRSIGYNRAHPDARPSGVAASGSFPVRTARAKVAELVDALDLESSGETRESSSLSFRTSSPDASLRGTRS